MSSADEIVLKYADTLSGAQREVVLALSSTLSQTAPDLKIKLAWGFPCWSGNERIFSVIAHKLHCNLQLWQGARIAASFPKRIEGSGKSLRHVKVASVDQIDNQLIEIIGEAVKLDATDPQRVR